MHNLGRRNGHASRIGFDTRRIQVGKAGADFARNARIICTMDGRELSQGKIRLYSFAVFKYYDIIIVFGRIHYFVMSNEYTHGGVLGTPDDLRQ